MSNPIPVFYTISDEYAEIAIVSITSLIANANRDREYNIHVIYQDLNSEHLAALAELSRPGFNIILNELGEQLDFIENRDGNRLNGSIFSVSIFFRLFLPDAFPVYDKGVYLDADTIIAGDISELYDIEIGDNLIAGTKDLSIAGVHDFIEYIEKGDGVPFDGYINSGVLLLNMAALRQAGLRERFLHIFNAYHANTVAPDQDYLNTLCLGKIHYLDRTWNAMPAPGLAPLPDPKIVHYNLFFKPWHYPVDYDELFWQYADEAGLEESFRTLLAAYSKEDSAADDAALAAMLAQSREVITKQSGLAPVFEKEPRL